MNIGQTLKKIRISKGLTRDELASNILSSSHYFKIEANQSNLTLDKFILILDKLNVEFNEFFFIHNHYAYSSKQKLSIDFMNLYYEQKTEALEDMLLFCETCYQKKQDIYYYHFSILIKTVLHDRTLNEEECQNIKNYLFNVQNYTLYEFRILINFLFILDIETIILLAKKMTKEFSKFKQFEAADYMYAILLLNVIDTLINNQHAEEAAYYIQLLEQHLTTYRDFFVMNALKFQRGCYKVLCEDARSGEAEIQLALSIFKELDTPSYDNHIAKYHKVFTQ